MTRTTHPYSHSPSRSSSTPAARRVARAAAMPVLLAAALAAAGCASRVPLYAEDQPPGLDSRGQVVDSSQVVPGYGKPVLGLDGWQGEIVGQPAPGSPFERLQIGMSIEQVRGLLGPPQYQGAYSTGKQWIPFFFGSDRQRYDLAYTNLGRLVFAGGTLTDPSRSNLILIVHNPRESGRQ